jgi:hypothetical protein|tara:strand:+ start:721 stop:915 length:195 start_codon:yes stop_codon:yes gene_type:complete
MVPHSSNDVAKAGCIPNRLSITNNAAVIRRPDLIMFQLNMPQLQDVERKHQKAGKVPNTLYNRF